MLPHKWALPEFREITTRWQREMIQANAWNAIYLENHDQARMISRYASDLPEFSESDVRRCLSRRPSSSTYRLRV